MKARYLRESKFEELSARILDNYNKYIDDGFEGYGLEDNEWSFASSAIEVNEAEFSTLMMPTKSDLFEAKNSEIVFSALSNINRFQANDPRLWTYISHTVGRKYISHRYRDKLINANNDGDKVKVIKQHFFCSRDTRQIRRDQGIARLWWNAALLSQLTHVSPIEAGEVLLSNTDIRASLIERPNLALTNAFEAAIIYLLKKYNNDPHDRIFIRPKKDGSSFFSYRDLFKEINRLGGHKNLQVVTAMEIVSIVEKRELAL